MRVFLFLILFIPAFSFAANCPSGYLYLGGTTVFSDNDVAGMCGSKLPDCITVPNGSSNNYPNVLVCFKPWQCNSPNVSVPGQYGVNYSCNPPPCPSSHSNNSKPGQCLDANGCNQDQSFLNGVCVNKKIEDIAARCMAAAGASQVATITVPSDGSGPTCSVGGPVGVGTVPACTTAPGGTACVISPLAAGDKTGFQCGSFNGAQVCVASSETNAIGTSSKTPGTSTQSGTPKTIEEQISENGQTTKIVKEVTPQTTSTTSVNDSSPLKEGQAMDSGAGPSPVAPITCANGQAAANIQSCDTSVICPADSYVAFGACIKKPTRTTFVAKDVTVTTTTVTNDADNTVVSQTSSTATSFVPVKNPTAPGTVDTQRSGQCDPTAKNYNECVGLLTSISDTEKQTITDSVESKTDTGLTTWNTEQKNSIQGNSNGLGVSTSVLDTMLNPFKISSQTCTSFTVNFLKTTKTLDCTRFEFFKKLFGWALYLYTIYYIFILIVKPVER